MNSANCTYTPVTVAWSVQPGFEVSSAYADVSHGAKIFDSHDLRTSSSDVSCPYCNGVGTFRFGPGSQVAAFDEDFREYLSLDGTTGSFAARGRGSP